MHSERMTVYSKRSRIDLLMGPWTQNVEVRNWHGLPQLIVSLYIKIFVHSTYINRDPSDDIEMYYIRRFDISWKDITILSRKTRIVGRCTWHTYIRIFYSTVSVPLCIITCSMQYLLLLFAVKNYNATS